MRWDHGGCTWDRTFLIVNVDGCQSRARQASHAPRRCTRAVKVCHTASAVRERVTDREEDSVDLLVLACMCVCVSRTDWVNGASISIGAHDECVGHVVVAYVDHRRADPPPMLFRAQLRIACARTTSCAWLARGAGPGSYRAGSTGLSQRAGPAR